MRLNALFFLALLSVAACLKAPAQSLPTPPPYMVASGQSHFNARVVAIEAQPALTGGALFLGDSLTEGGDWSRIFPTIATANHGVGWDTTDGVIRRLPQITRHEPDMIFLMIGTNDLFYDHSPAQIGAQVDAILNTLTAKEPQAVIYLQSVLPREPGAAARVTAINQAYRDLSARYAEVKYVDLFPAFATRNGTLRADLTYDGLHLNAAGYEVWADQIRDLAAK